MVDNADPVAELVGFLHVVSGEEDGASLTADLNDHLAQVAGRLGVQTGRRFVEDEHRGLGEQRLGKAYPLAHTRRVPLDQLVGALGKGEAL